VLTVLFGPLGMLYSTAVGALVMFLISFIIALVTFGLGIFLAWPVCVIWGAVAASNHNKRLLAGTLPIQKQTLIPQSPSSPDHNHAEGRGTTPSRPPASEAPIPGARAGATPSNTGENLPKNPSLNMWLAAGLAVLMLGAGIWAVVRFKQNAKTQSARIAATDAPRPVPNPASDSPGASTPMSSATTTIRPASDFVGQWYAEFQGKPTAAPFVGGHVYLKIARVGNDLLELREGSESNGTIYWAEQQPTLRLARADSKTFGAKIRSYNFRATHGVEFDYSIRITTLPNGQLQYTVASTLPSANEVWKAIRTESSPRATATPPIEGSPEPPSNSIVQQFVGSYGCLGQTVIGISFENGKFKIEEPFGGNTNISFGTFVPPDKIRTPNATYTLVKSQKISVKSNKPNRDGSYNGYDCAK
jgi:hypothetical protein